MQCGTCMVSDIDKTGELESVQELSPVTRKSNNSKIFNRQGQGRVKNILS